MDEILFVHEGVSFSGNDFLQNLSQLGASECDVLYIHSGMQFGSPNMQIGKRRILEGMTEVLCRLGVPTLLMPSYTFSFCNNEVFDLAQSASKMGALNEYVRKEHGWLRSRDPLMSHIAMGPEHGLLTQIGNQSVGLGSTFDQLTRSNLAVKFLFLGPAVADCFTYMHYLEAVADVPYRYNFRFSGTIVDGARREEDQFDLFIRDVGVYPGPGTKVFENMMLERHISQRVRLGAGMLTVVDLVPAKELYLELLQLSPSFFIEQPFEGPVRPDTFAPRKMVAL